MVTRWRSSAGWELELHWLGQVSILSECLVYGAQAGVARSPGSELVAELAQQALSRLDVGFGFDALAPRAIHDAENPAPAPGVGHDDFRRVGRRTVDAANLRHRLDGVQDVDWESAGHEDDEG